MQRKLTESGINTFFWRGTGRRPPIRRYYDKNGHVLYGRMKSDPAFMKGISGWSAESPLFEWPVVREEDRLIAIADCCGRSAEHGHAAASHPRRWASATDAQITAESGKPLESGQPACLPSWTRTNWRSTASVHEKKCRRVLTGTESRWHRTPARCAIE